MSNCTNCGAPLAPGSRFCTECGRPVAAAGPAGPTPPVAPTAPTPTPPRPTVPPITSQPPIAPVPPRPQPVMPQPIAPQPPAPQPIAVQPPAQSTGTGIAIDPAESAQAATVGDLYNDGKPAAVVVTDSSLLVMQGNAVRTEKIAGIRHAIVGDYDGDGMKELLLVTDSHSWVVRFSHSGSVHSGRVALKEAPEHLYMSPFTRDGQAVLMEPKANQIRFYVVHPARGLVEIAQTETPKMDTV